jgi:hypothetical protein
MSIRLTEMSDDMRGARGVDLASRSGFNRVELFPAYVGLNHYYSARVPVLLHFTSYIRFSPYPSYPSVSPKMSGPVKRTATAGADAVKPNNPLQSDFNADDTSSMDEDERYLVR